MDDFLDFGGYGSYLDQYEDTGSNWWDDIGSGDYSYGGDQWTVEDPEAYADWSKYIDYDPETGTFTNRFDPTNTEHYDLGSGEWLDPSYWQGGSGSSASGGSSATNWMRQLAMGQLPEGMLGDLLGGALFGGGLYNSFQNNELYKDQIQNQIDVNQQNADTTKFRADTERMLGDQNILSGNRDYVQQGMTNYRGLTSDLSNQALMEYYARTQPQKAQMMMGLVQAGNPDFAMNPMLQGGLSQYTANQNALADILKGYGGDYSSLRDRINLPDTVNYDILNGGSGQSPNPFEASSPIVGNNDFGLGSNMNGSLLDSVAYAGGTPPWVFDESAPRQPMYEKPMTMMTNTITQGNPSIVDAKLSGRGTPNLDRYTRSYSGTRG